MIGAIIGDIVGSRFEFNNTDKKDFKLFTKDCDFTDDTICTVAVADAMRLAYDSAACTHNHAEGVIGAVVTVRVIRELQDCVMLNNEIMAKNHAISIISTYYGNDWYKHLPRPGFFDVTCQGCVPLAVDVIVKSNSFEDAIRNAVAYGGDSDTLAAIVGSMAEALWGVPEELKAQAFTYLPDEMKSVITLFYNKYE